MQTFTMRPRLSSVFVCLHREFFVAQEMLKRIRMKELTYINLKLIKFLRWEITDTANDL